MAEHLPIACISTGRFSNSCDIRRRRTYLLDAGNMSGDIFHSHGVFYGQTMTLALYSRLINQYTAICRETYWNSEYAQREDWQGGAPAKARQTWSSSIATFRTVRGSCSWRTDFFSTPSTTTSFPRTPTCRQGLDHTTPRVHHARTAHVPFRTASRAYSTYGRDVMNIK